MTTKLARAVGLSFLGVLLLVLPVLGGCAGEDAKNEVVIGFMGDFTGPASATCNQLNKALKDYLSMIKEEDPVPDVDIKIATFDTRMEYARVPGGYEYLKGRGSDIFLNFNPIMQEMLIEKHQEDGIPTFTFVTTPDLVGQDWIYSFSVHYPWEAEAIVEWATKQWTDRPTDRAVKIGHVGVDGYVSTDQVKDKLEELSDSADYDIEVKTAVGLSTTSAWFSQVDDLADCDIIIVNCVGPQAASFVKDSIARGYDGALIGTSLAFLGFWDLIKDAVPSIEDLDGAYAMHAHTVWTDDSAFMDEVARMLHTYREKEYDVLSKGTSYMTGIEFAMILVDTIRRAAAEKTPDQEWSEALNSALENINMDMTEDGFGEAWACHGGSNVLHRQLKVIEYRVTAETDDWYGITDWYLPPSLES
jgi:hypothetical protein